MTIFMSYGIYHLLHIKDKVGGVGRGSAPAACTRYSFVTVLALLAPLRGQQLLDVLQVDLYLHCAMRMQPVGPVH